MRDTTMALVAALCLAFPATGRAEESEASAAGAEEEPAAIDESGTALLDEARREIAELRGRLESLEARAEAGRVEAAEDELAALRRAAEEAASAPETAEEAADEELSTDQVFSSGQRGLQALNPELSVVLDTGVMLSMRDGEPGSVVGLGAGEPDHGHEEGDGHAHSHAPLSETGFFFRHLGLHLETNLDPFSFTKIAVGVNPEGAHLEEAYVTWVRVAPGLSLTLGKFLLQFGVVNRWHLPSLDQFDQPLALVELLGAGGLNQVGLSLDWLVPTRSSRRSHEVIVQVTQPSNAHLFSGAYLDVPTVLARLRNYFDLTESTYLELGLTGMWGMRSEEEHDEEGEPVPAYDEEGEPILLYDAEGNEIGPLLATPETDVDAFRGNVWLAGVDLTLSWSPLRRERYRHVTWRSELYFVSQQHRAGRLQAVGAYSYLDAGLNEAWAIGVRGDVAQPFEHDNGGELRWQAAAYLTWWQSPWVKLRLQYSHAAGGGRPMEDRLVLQFVFAAGPHKHERY